MKKLLYVLLVVIALVGVTGCGGKEVKKEPVKVELTSENFEEYFTINAQVSDFNVDEKKSILGTDYVGYANLKVTIIPKKSFTTEGVSLVGKVAYTGLCWAGNTDYFSVDVDLNGSGEYQKTVTTGACPIFRPETPNIGGFYGKTETDLDDGEFFARDKKFVITKLEGSVIVEQ